MNTGDFKSHYTLDINSRSKRTLWWYIVTNLHETKNKRSSTINLLGLRTYSRSKRSTLYLIKVYKTSYEWHKLKQEIRAQSPFVKQLEKNKTKTFSTKFCVWQKKEWWYTTTKRKKKKTKKLNWESPSNNLFDSNWKSLTPNPTKPNAISHHLPTGQ